MSKFELKVHSYESFGTVDGPGVRFVVFVHGCPLRCAYCHNPDTWNSDGYTKTEIDDVINEIKKYKSFIKTGGVTVSGGEPLLYKKELIELFKELKGLGISTCIDTSGFTIIDDELKELLTLTDLILLDVKAIDNELHQNLAGVSNKKILAFASYLSEVNFPVWIRHVVVPTITDGEKDLLLLKEFLATLGNIERVELLPYHDIGVYKWKDLGLKYPLEGVRTANNDDIVRAKDILGLK